MSRFNIVLYSTLMVMFLSAPLYAAEGDEIVHEEDDWVIYDSVDPAKGPPIVPFASDYRQTVYLNFDGAKLKQGGNDARTNMTNLITQATLNYEAQDFSSMGGKVQGIKDVVKELRLLYGNYAVEFVVQRPKSGDYTMAMIGGNGQGCKGGGSAVGISPLDCKNTEKNDIVLIYKMKDSAKQLALVIVHELGHSFGLEHVEDQTDIMYPQLNAATCCWTKSKVQSGTCGRQVQDADAVLTENLGVGEGDKVEPRIWFVRPGPDAVLPPRFSFEVAAADDLAVHHVEVFVDGKKIASIDSEPFVAYVEGLSDGEHTIKATVFDYKPNEVSTSIKVQVKDACVEDGTCWAGKLGMGVSCEDGADCITGVCASNDGVGYCSAACEKKTKICPGVMLCLSSGGDDYYCANKAGYELSISEDDGGCSCSAGGSPGPGAVIGLMLLALLAISRRRR